MQVVEMLGGMCTDHTYVISGSGTGVGVPRRLPRLNHREVSYRRVIWAELKVDARNRSTDSQVDHGSAGPDHQAYLWRPV